MVRITAVFPEATDREEMKGEECEEMDEEEYGKAAGIAPGAWGGEREEVVVDAEAAGRGRERGEGLRGGEREEVIVDVQAAGRGRERGEELRGGDVVVGNPENTIFRHVRSYALTFNYIDNPLSDNT